MWYLLIPSCNLKMLAALYPNVKVVDLHGSGSSTIKGETVSRTFQWGSRMQQTNERIEINYTERVGTNALTMKQIADDLFNNHNIRGVTISKIIFYFENISYPGYNDYAMLEFVKHTPHKTIDQRRMVNSDTYPEWSLYRFIEVAKSALTDEMRRFDKSSVLTLASVNANQKAMNDPEYLRMFKMSFMQMYQLIETDYAIADTQFQTKGWAKA